MPYATTRPRPGLPVGSTPNTVAAVAAITAITTTTSNTDCGAAKESSAEQRRSTAIVTIATVRDDGPFHQSVDDGTEREREQEHEDDGGGDVVALGEEPRRGDGDRAADDGERAVSREQVCQEDAQCRGDEEQQQEGPVEILQRGQHEPQGHAREDRVRDRPGRGLVGEVDWLHRGHHAGRGPAFGGDLTLRVRTVLIMGCPPPG